MTKTRRTSSRDAFYSYSSAISRTRETEYTTTNGSEACLLQFKEEIKGKIRGKTTRKVK